MFEGWQKPGRQPPSSTHPRPSDFPYLLLPSSSSSSSPDVDFDSTPPMAPRHPSSESIAGIDTDDKNNKALAHGGGHIDDYRDDPPAEFGGLEGRRLMEKRLLRKLDARYVFGFEQPRSLRSLRVAG